MRAAEGLEELLAAKFPGAIPAPGRAGSGRLAMGAEEGWCTTRLHTLAAFCDYAAAGITLPAEIKPACQ
jgi:hypothetical protein